MVEELIGKLDVFVPKIVKNIGKKELIPEIQQEYDELIDFIKKLTLLTNEEFEELEKGMNNLESELKKTKEQNSNYIEQINSLKEEIKSLKEQLINNIALKEQFKKLNDDYNNLKKKYDTGNNEIEGYQLKVKNNEKLINDLQEEINKVKKEIFEKKEKILNYEKDIKQNEIAINQLNDKINNITHEKNDLNKSNVDLRNKNTEQQKRYEGKIKVLEKQLKHLSDANNNFVQENNEVQTQLKDFQMYTNMAKVNTKKLNKEDFSILEVMSKRAETAEMEVQKLLSYIEELKGLNLEIRSKIKPLEDYALLQIKHDHEISIGNDTIYDIQNKIFTDEERKEIFKLKNEPNELFQALIKLKTENLELHKHIKDITIECNQQLREARWKNK